MFPLRDINPGRTFPFVNYFLIALNTLIFVYQLKLASPELEIFLQTYSVVPKNFIELQNSQLSLNNLNALYETFFSLVSSTFLHGGWLHFILNMWVLQIFGNNIEDSMGHLRYFIFYLLAGIVGNITHIAFFSQSQIPLLGASGSIAGVMAAYLFLFPSNKVLTLIPIFIFPLFINIYSFFYIALWFGIQLFGGISQLSQTQVSGVAFWAHIGGFVWGALTHRFFLLRTLTREEFSRSAEE